MAAPVQLYSRLVLWLKILLPILALAILSTLFLFAKNKDIGDALPYAQVEIDSLARNPRLTKPEYSGVTSDGAAVSFSAASARPGKAAGDATTAVKPVTIYEADNHAKVTVHAENGRLDSAAGLLTLIDNVVVITSDGYLLRSDHMVSSLRQSLVTADGNVVTDAPFGRIYSGAMRLSGPPDDHLLVFNKGVRLVYTP
ncbi:MAG: LPS export ABC transporter periplasmic protein LptC [Albidovulum sp.]|jgi:lipopolysaccharide export system protein LptC